MESSEAGDGVLLDIQLHKGSASLDRSTLESEWNQRIDLTAHSRSGKEGDFDILRGGEVDRIRGDGVEEKADRFPSRGMKMERSQRFSKKIPKGWRRWRGGVVVGRRKGR